MAFAKTTRPTLARTLARPRLFRRLDRAGQRPVTWVWAPPGAGKTTVVASYLAARRQRLLWYQLDEGDADVGTFFYYLGRAAPSRRRPLPLLTSEYRQGLTVFTRRFFRELFGRLATPFVVVFDNYQEVPGGAELHEVMREAIAEIPERGRIIVLSRGEPPPAFARALVHETVAVLDWSELRFTASEARALVRTRTTGRWSSATVRALYERTDGWCAGLILMLDQAGGDGRPSPRSSAASPEVLFDYFAGEIFKRADPAVQDVLMQTAFLPRVTAWLRELEIDVHLLGPLFRSFHHRVIVWQALIRGDVARAVSYQPEMLRLAQLGGSPLDLATAHLTSAQTFHAHGDARSARAAVERAREIASAMRSDYLEFMARLIEAQLHLDGGREAEGLAALSTALALGRGHGYVNSHVWIPADMARLCVHALRAGVETEYVHDVVARRGLVPDPPPVEVEAWPWPIKIVTLGRFEVLRGGAPVRFSRKVQRKPLALLKALIALGGRAVREDTVADALWPDAAGDAAHRALASALHRLRGLLGRDGAVVRQDGHLSLDRRSCWVDVWAVEHLLAGSGAREQPLRRALDLYRGPFLDGEGSELPQAAALADGLRRTDAQKAADWYEEGLRVDPCAEDVCRSLMTTYHKLGRPAAVREAYERCRSALAERLGGALSAETERIFRFLRAD
jgi:DNA-binding SARP family transcriptional activator